MDGALPPGGQFENHCQGGIAVQKNNLAARAGRWSAQHRKRASSPTASSSSRWPPWSASAVGQRMLAYEDMGNGGLEVRRRGDGCRLPQGARASRCSSRPRAVRSRTTTQRFTAAVDDVVKRAQATRTSPRSSSLRATATRASSRANHSAVSRNLRTQGRGRHRRGLGRRHARRHRGSPKADLPAHRAVRRRERRQGPALAAFKKDFERAEFLRRR